MKASSMKASFDRVSRGRLAAPLFLAGISLFLAFWQRPYEAFSDTRIELLTDPGLFLSRVTEMWTGTIDLGHIQTSQFIGYLFPMGPFFAGGEALGIPIWIVQRFWIAALLCTSAWGIVRLVEALRPRTGGATVALAGLIYITSPFVTVCLNRGTVWLIPYATLPWLLVWAHRGVNEPRSWRPPAALALLIAASCAGLTPLVWLLFAVLLFVAFEAIAMKGFKGLFVLAWRTFLLSGLASLWWLVPVLVQARLGTDYLTFTEHPETILHTPSASESLRVLGYWVDYINGYPDNHPQVPSMEAYLLSRPTLLASFFFPAVAVVGVAALRRWRYAAFFGLMLALSVLVMSLGFPQASPLGRLITGVYYEVGPLQFMRTTYKAAPLAALSIAVLAALAIGSGLEGLRSLRLKFNGKQIGTRFGWVAASVLVIFLVLFWGRPIWQGNAVDSRLFFSSVPNAWVNAVADAQRTTPPDSRISILPGDLFGWYTWGGTQNAVGPGLSGRPVAVRQIVRAAPPSSAQLLESVDASVQQGRLVPGQLNPMLQLLGVGRVLIGSDTSSQRGRSLDPARLRESLAGQAGFQQPVARFGPLKAFAPPADRAGSPVTAATVEAFRAPRPSNPRITRVHSVSSATVLDGDAAGIVSLASVGQLRPTKALFYAGDLSRQSLAGLLADHPALVFSDSNRRRASLVTDTTANSGPTITATAPFSREFPQYDPFESGGEATRTVATYGGLADLFSPAVPQFALLPENRPYAAFDGRSDTAWVTEDENPSRRYISLALRRPAVLGAIEVKPHSDSVTTTRGVAISVNGGRERVQRVSAGWNRVPVGSGLVKTLGIRALGSLHYGIRAPSGFDEIRLPGVNVTESLRLPTRLATLARRSDLSSVPMKIALERITSDFPGHSGGTTGPRFALARVDMVDAEAGMRRTVTLPTGRSFAATGWASVRAAAPDASLDRLARMPGGSVYSSSARFEGLGQYRSSSAFDNDSSTSWQAEYDAANQPSVKWVGVRPVTVRRVRLMRLREGALYVTSVRVGTSRGAFDRPLPADGIIDLPVPVATDSLSITVTSVKRLPRPREGERQPRKIGFSEVEVSGIPQARPLRRGSFRSPCGEIAVRAHGNRVAVDVSGTLEDLDHGRPVRIGACGPAHKLPLRSGANLVVASAGTTFAPDHLLLSGAAPVPVPAVAANPSITPGGRVQMHGRGWLVLGQSYSPGWKAWCKNSQGGEVDLGRPVEIDGFANGWRINGASCVAARFAFGPQRFANLAYVVSLIAVLALLGLIFFPMRRGRGRRGRSPGALARDSGLEVAVQTANADAPLLVVVRDNDVSASQPLPMGRSVRVLLSLAGGLAVAVPIMYLANPDPSTQGINFDYPLHHVDAHWVALASMGLLLVACVIELLKLRAARIASSPDGGHGDRGEEAES
jgi:hypothetical protein